MICERILHTEKGEKGMRTLIITLIIAAAAVLIGLMVGIISFSVIL